VNIVVLAVVQKWSRCTDRVREDGAGERRPGKLRFYTPHTSHPNNGEAFRKDNPKT
jgi:hypothetical protein